MRRAEVQKYFSYMEEMQDKLQQYRQRKHRKQQFEELKTKFKRFLMLGTGANKNETVCIDVSNAGVHGADERVPATDSDGEADDPAISTDDEGDNMVAQPLLETLNAEEQQNRTFKYILWAVYTMFWITMYAIAIQMKFGLVFLMLSALFGIYFNTRTGPKNRNEISAYSVFNKNCESIDGTLKAEQFERELRYGSGSVK